MKQSLLIACLSVLCVSLALVTLSWQTRQERLARAGEFRSDQPDPRAYAVPADVQLRDRESVPREKVPLEGTAGMVEAPPGEWIRERADAQEILAAQAKRHADALAKMRVGSNR